MTKFFSIVTSELFTVSNRQNKKYRRSTSEHQQTAIKTISDPPGTDNTETLDHIFFNHQTLKHILLLDSWANSIANNVNAEKRI